MRAAWITSLAALVATAIVGRETCIADPPKKPVDIAALTADMHEYIAREVAAGFESADEIEKAAIEIYTDEAPSDVVAPLARRLTKQLIDEHLAAQADWPAVTDCDRLDWAFADLEKAGIVARQNFSCCGTCGVAEIDDEIKQRQKKGGQLFGYAFYHVQDTENAVDGGGLYLNYGATEDGEAAALAIGKEIVKTLNEFELKTEWNGSWDTRILVRVDWKRRR
jgi:hypothetical protein